MVPGLRVLRGVTSLPIFTIAFWIVASVWLSGAHAIGIPSDLSLPVPGRPDDNQIFVEPQDERRARENVLSNPNSGLENINSHALSERQDYYAFSGAIYIVGAGGQQLTGLNAASPAYCPNNAPQGCGNIGVWNWCCSAGTTCAWADYAQTYVGCCAQGSQCQQGSINRNEVQTVTVVVTTTLQYDHPHGPPATTFVAAGGGGADHQPDDNGVTQQANTGGIVIVGEATGTVHYNGFCTTIIAEGPNLPTSVQVGCGMALVVAEGVRPVARQLIWVVASFWAGVVVFCGGWRFV